MKKENLRLYKPTNPMWGEKDCWLYEENGKTVVFFNGIGGPDGADQYITIPNLSGNIDRAYEQILAGIA